MPPDRDHPPRRPSSRSERLVGLGLVLAGTGGFGLAYLLWWIVPAAMPAPPGLPGPMLPLLSPLICALPILAVGSAALVLLGLRRLVLGE